MVMEDFDKTEAADSGDFKIIPQGSYTAIVTNSSLDKTKEPWRASIELKIAIGEFKDRKTWLNYGLSGQGAGFFKRDVKTFGEEGVTLETIPAVIARVGQFKKPLDIYIKHNPYNGKVYANAYLNGLKEKVVDGIDENDEIPF